MSYEAILNRHSIRHYTDEEIPDEILEKICRAGLAAPSAMNTRPWTFVVVKDPDLLQELSSYRKYWKVLQKAKAAIIVTGQKDEYFSQNCAAATQNILLAASALGLGSVWLGLYPNQEPMDKIKNRLHLEENLTAFSVVALGYPEEGAPYRERTYEEDKIIFYR